MLARLALIVVAAAVVVLLAGRLSDERACSAALHDAFGISLGGSRADPERVAAVVRERCREPQRLASAGAGLAGGGHGDLGLALAQEAVREEPESFVAWSALARIEQDQHLDAGAAIRHARELNPRWRGPGPLRGPTD